MKKLLPEYVFSDEQLQKIKSLASASGLTEISARILYSRGIDTVEKIEKFMHPSEDNLLDPFLLRGMKEAVEMLTHARDEGQTVAVFGDYDADGVCAASIMFFALRAFGIDAHVYVPERTGGYGLNEETIDRIFDECAPELFLTVDCGISSKKEVQYLYELGADVIVTDHHELPEELPDCVIVNPKLGGEYPYDNLCGAGVAWKVACALLGKKAYAYLDFVALATVADSVPLTGENRDIVHLGLQKMTERPRPSIAPLLKSGETVTTTTVSFTLAPKVNAAGRMGDANLAFRLFTAEDENEIRSLAQKMHAYNLERQSAADELYRSAKAKIKEKGAYRRVIMLWDESWNTGFVGLVAARLAEEYNRPILLFVKNGKFLKGSARSNGNVNIYNALKNCSAYLPEFGGHSQAAGLKVAEEDFDKLEEMLNEEMNAYPETDFEKTVFAVDKLTGALNEKLAREIHQMEPFGVGAPRPLFYTETADTVDAHFVGAQSSHLSFRLNGSEYMFFSAGKRAKILCAPVPKKIVFELNVSTYKEKETVKGFVHDVIIDGREATDSFDSVLSSLRYPKETDVKRLTKEEGRAFIEERQKACAYGLCLVAYERKTLDDYAWLSLPCDLYFPSTRSLQNTLVFAPSDDCDLSGFREVVYLDEPAGYLATDGAKTFLIDGRKGYLALLEEDISREKLLSVYTSLKNAILRLEYAGKEQVLSYLSSQGFGNLGKFALAVFEELGLLGFAGGFTLYRGKKTDLNDSILYSRAVELKEKANGGDLGGNGRAV